MKHVMRTNSAPSVPPAVQQAFGVTPEQEATSTPVAGQSEIHSSVPNRAKRSAWVVVASGALALFTVFVLLDTFAIARVQQKVEATDTATLFAHTAQAAQIEKTSTDAQDEGDASQEQVAAGVYYIDHVSASAATQSEVQETYAAQDIGSADTNAAEGESTKTKGEASGGTGEDASNETTEETGNAQVTATSYSDDNMSITLTTTRAYDTTVYIADIQVSSAEYLKTAFAQNAYGRNIKEGTSSIAEGVGAVLAINGDYYGFRNDGYVLRNGVLYRETPTSGEDALVVYSDGTMASANQSSVTAQDLASAGAWQVLSFGPVLLENGELAVVEGQEVTGKSMASNPRTAIGMVDPLHYIVVVSDGRSNGEAGLSLAQLAQVMKDAGATFAYNLDGGGSTTLYFNGKIINNPTGGRGSSERAVSDIVYFG